MLYSLPRILVSLIGGALVAATLLWIMQWLVTHESIDDQIAKPSPVMEFVRLQREPETRLRKRQLPKQPEPEQVPPDIPELPPVAVSRPVARAPQMSITVPGVPLNIAGPYIGPVQQGPPDRDFMVLSRLPPQYPYRAKRRGVEGWVKVSFEITAEGSVRDLVVVDSDPPDVFDREAMRAVAKWKFKPRIRDGKATAARVEQRVDFRLRSGEK